MNLSEIVIRAQRQLGDESEVEITKDDIKRWANDSQLDIVRKTECLQEHSETSPVANDGTYPLPEDFIFLRRVTYKNELIYPTTLGEIDKLYPSRDTGTATGTPTMYFVWNNVLHLYPWPDASGSGTLDIYYVRAPVILINDEDIPEIPVYMHEDMVRYCIARGKELDEEDTKAAAVMQEYDERLAESKYEAQNPQSDSYPSVRLCPGDDW
jgi:hypothetical protein